MKTSPTKTHLYPELVKLFDALHLNNPRDRGIMADALEEAGLDSLSKDMRDMTGCWGEMVESSIELRKVLTGQPCVTVPTAGMRVEPDEWERASVLEEAGEHDESKFYIASGRYAGVSYPVNITVTGRTLRKRGSELAVRVNIEFVTAEGEDKFSGGWMYVN